jgi:DNA polymerase I
LLRSHHEVFAQFWRWIAAVYDAGISNRVLETTFGWRMRVLPSVKSGTLLNWPMQANGGDMLRIACCLATKRGIKIVAPIHDAILVEGPAKDIDDIVTDLKQCMTEASRAVLGGPTVRVDAKIIRYPNRYVDDRDGAPELWSMVMRLLDKKRAA